MLSIFINNKHILIDNYQFNSIVLLIFVGWRTNRSPYSLFASYYVCESCPELKYVWKILSFIYWLFRNSGHNRFLIDKWSFLLIIAKAGLIDKKSKKLIFPPSLSLTMCEYWFVIAPWQWCTCLGQNSFGRMGGGWDFYTQFRILLKFL